MLEQRASRGWTPHSLPLYFSSSSFSPPPPPLVRERRRIVVVIVAVLSCLPAFPFPHLSLRFTSVFDTPPTCCYVLCVPPAIASPSCPPCMESVSSPSRRASKRASMAMSARYLLLLSPPTLLLISITLSCLYL